MSEEKKKMYYYYGGKEKKAGEIKKRFEGLASYDRDFDLMMDRFQREFDDFLSMPPMWKRWMNERPGFPMMPFRHMMMPSVDVEDRGKDYRIIADLTGFTKEDINVEVSNDSVMIHAKKNMAEEEKQKNMYAKNEWLKRFTEELICQTKLSQMMQKQA